MSSAIILPLCEGRCHDIVVLDLAYTGRSGIQISCQVTVLILCTDCILIVFYYALRNTFFNSIYNRICSGHYLCGQCLFSGIVERRSHINSAYLSILSRSIQIKLDCVGGFG